MGNENGADRATLPGQDGVPVPARAELADAPPFLTWRAIYLIVLAALAAEIAVGAVVTGLY